MLRVARRTYAFPPNEIAGLAKTLERDLPAFVPVVASFRFECEELVQSFFSAAAILRLTAEVPAERRTACVAWLPRLCRFWVLTDQLANLNLLAKTLPPDGLADPREAARYARMAASWVTTTEHGEVVVSSLAEVPWLGDAELRAEAEQRLAGRIKPEIVTVSQDGACQVHQWMVCERRLFERTLAVSSDGQLEIRAEARAEDLPVELDLTWR
jgi:hypothetical protein